MADTWKTVRVFISSTFRDMHAERDHLLKVTFPKLRKWCEERHLHLIDIDLRWGVTKEQADNGAAIEICLKEIDGSRPFCLCILGQRYGWVPDELPPEEWYAFHGPQARIHLSITHLEILHAALDPLTSREGRVATRCQQAFFYFRDADCVPDPDRLPALDGSERQELRAAFFEASEVRRRMLHDLKAEIRRRYDSDGRVFDYRGRWVPGTENAEDDQLRGRLVDLDDFGERVEADLKRGIEEQYAEHLAQAGRRPDPLAEEQSFHEAFIEQRTRVHVPRFDLEWRLEEALRGDAARLVVLSGPPGSGKSALLAHWVRSIASPGCGPPPSVEGGPDSLRSGFDLVLARFIGASPASSSLPGLMANLCAELRERFELTEEVVEVVELGPGRTETRTRRRPMEVPREPSELARKWPRFLEGAAERGRVLLVLDALNQLDRSADPRRLAWLTKDLPVRIRVVVSVADRGAVSRADHRPAEGEPVDWLAALRRVGSDEVQVPRLSDEDRRQIIRELPSVFAKCLDVEQVALLSENEATRNPLYLTVALEELRVFGSFAKLAAEIARLPRPDGARGEDGIEVALDRLFGQVLDRLEREAARRVPGLVPALFRLLASARDGLSEAELDGVLARGLPELPAPVRGDVMQVALRQVRPYLVRKGTRQGALLGFFHRSFESAVRARYLAHAEDRRASHVDLARYFAERGYRLGPVPGGDARAPDVRTLTELPWQVAQLGRLAGPEGRAGPDCGWPPLADLLRDLPFLEAKAEAGLLPELLDDFAAADLELPPRDPVRGLLRLLAREIRNELAFLERRPTAVFQALWNRCWGHDRQQAARAEELLMLGVPPVGDGPRESVQRLLERWRSEKAATQPGFRWCRTLLPQADDRGVGSRLLQVFRGHVDISSIAYSPDGRYLMTGGRGDGTVRVWDVATGRELVQLVGHGDGIECLAVAPAGDVVASGARDRTVRLWHIGSGVEVARMEGHRDSVTAVAFAPDGTWLVSGSDDGTARVWDARTGREVLRLEGPGTKVTCVAAPDDALFLLGDDGGAIRVSRARDGGWQTLRPRQEERRPGLGHPVLAFSPDTVLAAVTEDIGTVGILETWTGRMRSQLKLMHRGGLIHPRHAAFSRDRRWLVLGTSHDVVVLVDLGAAPVWKTVIPLASGGTAVSAIAPDGLQVATGRNIDFANETQTWDIGDRMSLLQDALLRINHGLRPPERPRRPLRFRAFSPDGRWFVSSGKEILVHPEALVLWRMPDAEPFGSLKGHELFVAQVVISPDARLLASIAQDLTVRLWDAGLRLQVACLGADEFEVADRMAPFHSFGGAAVVHADQGPQCLAFAPDGGRLACGFGEGDVRVWDAEGHELRRLGQPGRIVRDVAFSPDGRTLATAYSDGAAVVWNPTDGSERARFRVDGQALCLAFSPDGRRLAVLSSAGPLVVKELPGVQSVVSFTLPQRADVPLRGVENRGNDPVLAFSPDGERLVIVARHRGVWIGHLASGHMEELPGTGDPAAFAREPSAWRARACDQEVLFEAPWTREPLAWFPSRHEHLLRVSPADERTFVISSISDTTQVLRLEGDEPAPPAGALPVGSEPTLGSDRPPLVTAVRLFDAVAGQWEDRLSVACPWCGLRFEPRECVLAALEEGSTGGDPAGQGADPRLQSACSHCRRPVRFNPFVGDRRAATGADYAARLEAQERRRGLHRRHRDRQVAAPFGQEGLPDDGHEGFPEDDQEGFPEDDREAPGTSDEVVRNPASRGLPMVDVKAAARREAFDRTLPGAWSVLSPQEAQILTDLLDSPVPERRWLENAQGVCLMRLGRVDEAVQLFRPLVLGVGLRIRPGVPAILATNFATALLLAGHVDGCLGVLDELEADGDRHPAADRLRSCIDRWRVGLTWGQRLRAALLGRQNPVRLDFSPGVISG